ncbi:hypothetical protein F443_23074, partial [Phytophthora nicotianae P1569]
LLKREWKEGKRPHRGGPRALENNGAEDSVPPLRDKEVGDGLDEELLREYLIEVGGTRNVAFLDRAVGWARCYFEVESRGIGDKLRKRERGNPETVDSDATSTATTGRRKVTFQLPTKEGAAVVAEEAPEVYW